MRTFRFTGRQTFLLERTKSPPMVFTNHETRNTNHGLFPVCFDRRMVRNAGWTPSTSSAVHDEDAACIARTEVHAMPNYPGIHRLGFQKRDSCTGNSFRGFEKYRYTTFFQAFTRPPR